MTHLLRKPVATTGKVHDITPQTAGWSYVGFGLYHLKAGETASEPTGDREVILVMVFAPPYHPYTEALLSAVPIADTSIQKEHIVLEGDIPSAMNPPTGCPFQTRCRWKSKVAGGICERDVPPIRVLADGHQIKCHLPDDELANMRPVIKVAAE